MQPHAGVPNTFDGASALREAARDSNAKLQRNVANGRHKACDSAYARSEEILRHAFQSPSGLGLT